MNTTSRLGNITVEQFESGDISAEEFNHAAHVHAAWLLVSKFTLGAALARFDAALQRLVATLGARQKYNATVTGFFVLLIAERSVPGESWAEFCADNRDVIEDASGLLNKYYRATTLSSSRAKTRFLLPDKALRPSS